MSDISLLRNNTDLRKRTAEAGQLCKVKEGESTNPICLIKNTQTYTYQDGEISPVLIVESYFTKGNKNFPCCCS